MKGILVNIFGGIMRCDVIAEGVVAAVKRSSSNVPLVVRLEGTNVEKGREILAAVGTRPHRRQRHDDAARRSCDRGGVRAEP